MFYNRTEAVAKDKVGHIRETADRCDGEHQCDGREPLIPMCVVELAVVFVLNLAEEQLADNSQNVDCRNHNRRCGDNRKRVTEEVAVAENGVVIVVFSNEPKKMVISATNPLKPGKPSDARPAMM